MQDRLLAWALAALARGSCTVAATRAEAVTFSQETRRSTGAASLARGASQAAGVTGCATAIWRLEPE